MKNRFRSFSGRLSRSVVITVLVIMSIISVIVFYVTFSGMLVYSRAYYSDMTEKTQGNMAVVMSKVEVSAENIIDELSWHLTTPDLVLSTLQYELNTNRHLYGCGIAFLPDYYSEKGRWYEPYALNASDGIAIRDIGSASHDYFSSEWFDKGLSSPEGVWSNPYFDEEGAKTVLCTFARLVNDPDGNPVGVFGADISLVDLSSFIEDNVRKANRQTPFLRLTPKDPNLHISCFIIGPDGDYIVHPDQERILKTNFYDYAVGDEAEEYRELGDLMRAGKTGRKIVEIDDIQSDVYFAPLLDSGWSMAIVVPVRRMLQPSLLFGGIIIFLILLGLVIVFFICNFFIKQTTKPLISLAESAQEVAQGNFDTELPRIKSNDEIRLLRDSFDNMQKSLSQYIDELTETTAQKASMESELDVARKIQMSILPRTWPAFPERKNLDIYGSVAPAKAVGGDLFDFRLRKDKLFFCIGDVSGKGIPASLIMTEITSMFRTLSASEDSPARILSSINTSLSAQNDNLMFVTLFVGILNLDDGNLQYSNAGHNAPFVISGGKPRMLKVDPNMALGINPDQTFSLQDEILSPGSILFLYTDGLTEATRTGGQMFQEGRVKENLSGLDKDISTRHLITQMTKAVQEYVGESEQSDDLTMLAIKRT